MTTRWTLPALGTLALAALSGNAHAAWGHSDYAHVEAYRQLETVTMPRPATNGRAQGIPFKEDPATIRAFDDAFTEPGPVTVNASTPSGNTRPARS